MRRLLMAGLASVVLSGAGRAQQQTIAVTGGTATLTQLANGATRVDLLFHSFVGAPDPNSRPDFALDLQYDSNRGSTIIDITSTLFNGATVVGTLGPGPRYTVGQFNQFINPTTLIGRLSPDIQDWILVSPSCTPLTPHGFTTSGVPYYGSTAAEYTGYFQTCASPDAVVDVSFSVFHTTFVAGTPLIETPALLATPEPASVALMATGLLTVAGIARRRRAPIGA